MIIVSHLINIILFLNNVMRANNLYQKTLASARKKHVINMFKTSNYLSKSIYHNYYILSNFVKKDYSLFHNLFDIIKQKQRKCCLTRNS